MSQCLRVARKEMEIQHFSHHHPLVFIQDHSVAARCLGSEKPLAPQIQHPFHPKHPLTLLPKSPYPSVCDLCGKEFEGFVYTCYDCKFDLHINCALLQSSIAAKFPNSLHPHLLFFIQNPNKEVEPDCSVCQKPISGPFYHCSDCTYPFKLHKECAELELAPQIQHPLHPKHTLTLLPESPYGGANCCNLCGKKFQGFAYNCGACQFDLDINCALLQSSIAANFPNSLHPHPLFFIQNHNREVELDCSWC
ncbi:hypothetical protein V6Z11_D02G037700, partial [Gossypium hirsutum]|uniref:DC1 domain-containing protein n=1 Tax=Gossypium hirsutum TaxID=3635 RepID=A0A1U8LM75_GOSHI|nr:uncharacterized protein LOC107927681 [Gossypium hirsutum]